MTEIRKTRTKPTAADEVQERVAKLAARAGAAPERHAETRKLARQFIDGELRGPERTAAPAELAEESARVRQARAATPPRLPPGAPVRVTLNIPPGLYRQLQHWMLSAAETTGVPQVGVQDALRAMIRVVAYDLSPETREFVLAALRDERA